MRSRLLLDRLLEVAVRPLELARPARGAAVISSTALAWLRSPRRGPAGSRARGPGRAGRSAPPIDTCLSVRLLGLRRGRTRARPRACSDSASRADSSRQLRPRPIADRSLGRVRPPPVSVAVSAAGSVHRPGGAGRGGGQGARSAIRRHARARTGSGADQSRRDRVGGAHDAARSSGGEGSATKRATAAVVGEQDRARRRPGVQRRGGLPLTRSRATDVPTATCSNSRILIDCQASVMTSAILFEVWLYCAGMRYACHRPRFAFLKLLVTGGAGYIGSIVAASSRRRPRGRGARQPRARPPRRRRPAGAPRGRRSARCATPSHKALSEGFDGVLHFAALALVGESVEPSRALLPHQRRGTLNLLEVMQRCRHVAAGVLLDLRGLRPARRGPDLRAGARRAPPTPTAPPSSPSTR